MIKVASLHGGKGSLFVLVSQMGTDKADRTLLAQALQTFRFMR